MTLTAEYVVTGEASPKRARIAGWIDAGAALVVAALAFPFPVVRMSATTLVFVLSMLVVVVAVHWGYLVLTIFFFGRTPGMYLMDLGFEGGAPRSGKVMLWALGAIVVAGPHPVRGFGARLSGLVVRSTSDAPVER